MFTVSVHSGLHTTQTTNNKQGELYNLYSIVLNDLGTSVRVPKRVSVNAVKL